MRKKPEQIKEQGQEKKKTGKKPSGMKRGRAKKQETAKKTEQIKEQGQEKKKTGKKPGGMKRGRAKK